MCQPTFLVAPVKRITLFSSPTFYAGSAMLSSSLCARPLGPKALFPGSHAVTPFLHGLADRQPSRRTQVRFLDVYLRTGRLQWRPARGSIPDRHIGAFTRLCTRRCSTAATLLRVLLPEVLGGDLDGILQLQHLPSSFKFRAVLTNDKSKEVELNRV